jgi:hypothetical protein
MAREEKVHALIPLYTHIRTARSVLPFSDAGRSIQFVNSRIYPTNIAGTGGDHRLDDRFWHFHLVEISGNPFQHSTIRS